MANIYLFSGPCGCGKTTLSNVFARCRTQPVCIIHGDDFQDMLVYPEDASCPAWEDVLRYNWQCILDVARHALQLGMDVVIDYVVEDELPRVKALAREFGATLHYIVLTASKETLRQRLQARGDAWLTERALFLKAKLDELPENQGHILDITGLTMAQALQQLEQKDFIV